MPKTYTPKQVIAKFKKLGFVEDRQSANHKIFYKEAKNKYFGDDRRVFITTLA